MKIIIKFILSIVLSLSLTRPVQAYDITHPHFMRNMMIGSGAALLGGKAVIDHLKNKQSATNMDIAQPTETTFYSDRRLGENVLRMVQKSALNSPNTPLKKRLDIHHVVPWNLPLAEPARIILQKWQISLHDPVNAAILPWSVHRGPDVHGMNPEIYSEHINGYMRLSDQLASHEPNSEFAREIVMEALRKKGDRLVIDSKDILAMGFQTLLRTAERGLRHPRAVDIRANYPMRLK